MVQGGSEAGGGLIAYARGLGVNLLFAGIVFGLWAVIRHRSQAKNMSAWLAWGLTASTYALLAAASSISVLYFLMLGIALVGLFLRPPKIATFIDHAVTWALRIAAVVLGLLLVGGVGLWKGVMLGVAAYSAQILVGFLLTRGLPKKDRWHISFAQQNGITAIVLALLFEPVHPGTVAIVAPAILVTNGIHWLANKIVDKRFAR